MGRTHEMAANGQSEGPRRAREEADDSVGDALDRFPPQLCEIERQPWGAIRKYEIREFENADTRQARAIAKELKWLIRNGSRFLPEDIAE